MPELPEVETVLRGISPILEGNQIDYAQVNRPDLRRPFPNNLAKRLKNRKINFLPVSYTHLTLPTNREV